MDGWWYLFLQVWSTKNDTTTVWFGLFGWSCDVYSVLVSQKVILEKLRRLITKTDTKDNDKFLKTIFSRFKVGVDVSLGHCSISVHVDQLFGVTVFILSAVCKCVFWTLVKCVFWTLVCKCVFWTLLWHWSDLCKSPLHSGCWDRSLKELLARVK